MSIERSPMPNPGVGTQIPVTPAPGNPVPGADVVIRDVPGTHVENDPAGIPHPAPNKVVEKETVIPAIERTKTERPVEVPVK